MGILSSIKKAVDKTLDYVSAPLSQPLTFITQGPTAAAKKVETTRKEIAAGTTSASKVIKTTLASTAIVATGVLAVGGAGAGVAGAVAKKVVTSKPVATVLLGTGALAVAAPKTLQAIAEKPEVAKVAVAAAINPTLGIVAGIEQGSSLLKEAVTANKDTILDVATTVGLIGAGVGGAILVDKSIDYFSKLKNEEQQFIKETPKTVSTMPSVTNNTPIPQTPQTQTITKGATTGKRRRKKATIPPQNIVQSVKIAIQNNNNSSKKYLNVVPLAKSYGRIK